MRIIHVVTLVSPDGAYGGPVRVAMNQLRELARLGHEVELVAGSRGFGPQPPTELEGIPVRLFEVSQVVPRAGYAGLVAPGLSRYIKSRLSDLDLVHVHLARDLITMPVAQLVSKSDVPLFAQTHGMIVEPRNLQGRLFDLLIGKKVLLGARTVFALTRAEKESLTAVAGPVLQLESIANGVPMPTEVHPSVSPVNVLFLARLHARKRPVIFVEMAKQLVDEGFDATFSIVGPDEGEAPAVESLIRRHGLSHRIAFEGALAPEETLNRIAECGIYVLPSVGEVFPMSVLEAMSVGRAVVITTSNGLAEPLAAAGAALVADETLESLVDATRSLLADAELRDRLSHRARAEVALHYSIESVARQLIQAYTRVTRDPRNH